MANTASIRLGTTGKAQVKADFADIGSSGTASFKAIGDAGDAQAKRWSKSYENAGRDVEAALERQRLAASKISAIMPQTAVQMQVNAAAGSNTRFGGGYAASASDRQTSSEGTARQSAMFFAALAAEEENLAARTRSLVSAIDPAFAAQERFNREIGEARTLVSAGTLSLDQYVAKLGIEQQALDSVVGVHGKVAGATGQQRQSYMMLGQQMQDFAVQTANGGSIATAFSQQIGQAAFAIQGMGGKLAGVGAFLTGPWGIASTVALTLFAPLVAKLFEGSDALEKETKSLKDNAEKAIVASQAKAAFSKTEIAAKADISSLTEELNKQNEALRTNSERLNIRAKTDLETFSRAQVADVAKLAGLNASPTKANYSDRINLQKDIDARSKLITDAEVKVQQTRVLLAVEAGKRMADPIAQINRRYDEQARVAQAAADKAAKGHNVVTTALTRQLGQIDINRAAAIKAEQEKQKAIGETSSQYGREVTSSQASAIARAAGLQVNSADRSTARQQQLYDAWVAQGKPKENPVAKPGTSAHERGNALDIQFEAGVTAKKIKDAFAAEGVRLTKVFAETGHWHIEWSKTAAQRAASTDAAKDARNLAAANRELDSDLEEVVKQFDPARAAADEYATSLKKIAALRGAGKLTADQAGDYTYALFKERQAKAAADQAASFKTVFGDIPDPFEAGNAGWRAQQDEQINAWTVENERRQQVQQEGVRTVAGLYRNLMSGGTRSIFDSFKEMGINAIAQLAAKWTMSQIGKLSGSGGFIGSLASLITGTSKATATTAGAAVRTTAPPAYATGTEYASGGAAIVGEFGEELVNLPRGSRVTPAAETRRMLAGNDNGPRATNHFHLEGAVVTQDLLDQMVQIGNGAAVRGAAGGSEMAGRNLSLAQSRALA